MSSPLFESQVQQKEMGVARNMCRTQLVIEVPPKLIQAAMNPRATNTCLLSSVAILNLVLVAQGPFLILTEYPKAEGESL